MYIKLFDFSAELWEKDEIPQLVPRSQKQVADQLFDFLLMNYFDFLNVLFLLRKPFLSFENLINKRCTLIAHVSTFSIAQYNFTVFRHIMQSESRWAKVGQSREHNATYIHIHYFSVLWVRRTAPIFAIYSKCVASKKQCRLRGCFIFRAHHVCTIIYLDKSV
jgi:hypothetical protein